MGTDPVDTPVSDSSAGRDAAPTDERTITRGVRVGIAAYVIWGLLTIYWKQLDAFDAFELIAWRMVCAAVVMAGIVTIRRSWPRIRAAFADRGTLLRLAGAAVLLTANWGSYVWAVVNDRVIETALGYFMAPLATMAIGVFVLREHPTPAQRLAFALASIAVVILTVASGQPPWIAVILAATWSVYGLSKRQIGLDAIDSLAGETFVLIVPAAVVLMVLSGQSTSVVARADAMDWVFVLGTGAVTAVPLMLFASAAKSIPFTLLGPLNLIVPVINFGLGWLLYGEHMPPARVVGFGFVWVALVVVMYDRVQTDRRMSRRHGSAAPVAPPPRRSPLRRTGAG